MSRLGLRALLRAASEAFDQVGGPSMGAAVLAIVRERPRLRTIIDDMRGGIERLKADLDEAARQQTEVFRKHQNDELAAIRAITDLRAQRDHAEQEIEKLAVQLTASLEVSETATAELAQVKAERDAHESSWRTELADAVNLRQRLRACALAHETTLQKLHTAQQEVDRLKLELGQACAAGEALQLERDRLAHDLDLAQRHIFTEGDSEVES